MIPNSVHLHFAYVNSYYNLENWTGLVILMSAVVAVDSACSVPVVILNNIQTICYESSDLSRLDYQKLFRKGAHDDGLN